uniref:PlsC domain-containing protein n=1 Tax=Panagrellus redivivus TaxID=6233 RepID=A0A7E4VPV4_PANRE
MWQVFLLYYFYLLLCIVSFVILLSVTGRSTGIREKAAELLLLVFEWASTQITDETFDESDEESSEEEEFPPPAVDDDVASTSSASSWTSGKPGRRKRRSTSNDHPLISRQWSESIENKLSSQSHLEDLPQRSNTVKVIVNDTLEFVTAGVESIIEDSVTNRFSAAQLASWNLLSRNKSTYVYINWKLNLIYLAGVLFRYVVLFPIRFILFITSLCLMFSLTAIIGHVPNPKWRKALNRIAMLTCFRIFSRSFSSIIRHHNTENMAKGGGICVANHTSPIDVMILSCDNVYAMIGQRQGGILGLLQSTLSKAEHHIWFERSEAKDRASVSHALEDHVNDPTKLPILIFPEGTCINNTSVMLFKKGSFEVASTIYPIALKYDNRLGDAFWNSHTTGYFAYLMGMMTSWALICDVWYLPSVTRQDDETAIDFARRVKRMIAKKGGLVDLEWDGNLKRSNVPERLKQEQKEMFYNYLQRTTSLCSCDPPDVEKLKRLMEEPIVEAFSENENESPDAHADESTEYGEALLDEKLHDGAVRQRRQIPEGLIPRPLASQENTTASA